MKTKAKPNKSRDEFEQTMREQILDAYSTFIEDYPKNRDEILSMFDEIIQKSEGRKKIQDYCIGLKNSFVEVGNNLEAKKAGGEK